MKCLVGGPLLVGGLGPGPLRHPFKSGPDPNQLHINHYDRIVGAFK